MHSNPADPVPRILIVVGVVLALAVVLVSSLEEKNPASVDAFARSEVNREIGEPGASLSFEDSKLITRSSIGPICLGMTLDQAKRALPGAKLQRATDGDGIALVVVKLGDDDQFFLYAEEADSNAPIQWNSKIFMMYTFNSFYRTADGVHPGSSIYDVARVYGPVVEASVTEIEAREYITFSRQPPGLTFRLNYTGIYSANSRQTTKFGPGAKILGIQTDYWTAR